MATKQQKQTPDSARSRAYNRATKRLREQFPDQWNVFIGEEYEKEGLTYRRRLSEEEKAEQTVADLLEKYPSLRSLVSQDEQVA